MLLRIALCTALLTVGCDGDPAGPARVLQNDLVFVREDGTTISFAATTHVWCGAWEPGEVAVPAVHVFAGNAQGGWQLRAVRADVAVGESNTFPNTFIWDDPGNVDLFIFDPPNELSTQTDDSSGNLTFTELNCAPGGTVAFTIDAVVGSEFGDLPPVSVSGSFRGTVGVAPF